jgi:predicted HTH transcriptional regulator
MTDDVAQSAPTPTESAPAPEVASPTPTEPTSPAPEPAPVAEQAVSEAPASVIQEKSQSTQEIPADSRPMSQQTSTPQPSKQVGHKWNANDRAKSAATQTRKIDARLVKIIEYAKEHGGKITNDEIEKLLHVSDATASRYAKILVERGVLKNDGKGRGAVYILTN